MALRVSIGFSTAQLAKIEGLLGPFSRGSDSSKALQAAVSRTVTTGVALIARRLGAEVNLKIADIKATITSRRGSYDKPAGLITVTRKTTWLGNFLSGAQRKSAARRLAGNLGAKVRRRGGGVTVKVRKRASGKYGTTQTFPHAFIAVMPKTTHLGIFRRVGVKRPMKSGRYAGKVREVIARMRGPSALGVFLNAQGQQGADTIISEVTGTLADTLQKNYESQISRFLNRK